MFLFLSFRLGDPTAVVTAEVPPAWVTACVRGKAATRGHAPPPAHHQLQHHQHQHPLPKGSTRGLRNSDDSAALTAQVSAKLATGSSLPLSTLLMNFHDMWHAPWLSDDDIILKAQAGV